MQSAFCWVSWCMELSPGFAAKLQTNLAGSGLAADSASLRRLIPANGHETGKGALELLVPGTKPGEGGAADHQA